MTKEKILLFAGTAETSEISRHLLEHGYTVTVSTVSTDSLLLDTRLPLTRITGAMNRDEIHAYLLREKFSAVVCAVHPYAATARDNIITACSTAGTPLYIYIRKVSELPDTTGSTLLYASSHEQAANIAADIPGNILLTTGSRNLMPYMQQIPGAASRIYARVLNCKESETALNNAGIRPENAILARGPFSVTTNIQLINRHQIRIVITKDGGKQGGTPEKITAAAQTGCTLILITRPELHQSFYTDTKALISDLQQKFSPSLHS